LYRPFGDVLLTRQASTVLDAVKAKMQKEAQKDATAHANDVAEDATTAADAGEDTAEGVTETDNETVAKNVDGRVNVTVADASTDDSTAPTPDHAAPTQISASTDKDGVGNVTPRVLLEITGPKAEDALESRENDNQGSGKLDPATGTD
jgi:hypothetical protein